MLLNASDFTFTIIDQHRNGVAVTGISGKILLADNGPEKYAVKYQDPFDAAIEFMAITLAEKLRLDCTPTAHLFMPSDQFPHAVGIQYLPNLHKPTSKNGILKCVILNSIIQNGDKCEYTESEDRRYTIDFGESFCFDFHNKTEDFLEKCRLAQTDIKVRQPLMEILQVDYERYMHNLGYVNDRNILDTGNMICESLGLEGFTMAEVQKEWSRVWRRLRYLKDDAFVPMRSEISVVYGEFFANACWSFIKGMVEYLSE